MKKHLTVTAIIAAAALAAGLATAPATQQDPPTGGEGMEGMPPMPPPPGEHHEWLQQLVGEWTTESEMAPGMPDMKTTGTDTVRSLGGRWILCDHAGEFPGMGPFTAVLTLGYNPETGKYQGTWIASIEDHMWIYEGTLDPTGKILTLETEGPDMMNPAPGKTAKYRDVIEIKSADHRTMTSSALVEGEWVEFVTMNYHRK